MKIRHKEGIFDTEDGETLAQVGQKAQRQTLTMYMLK